MKRSKSVGGFAPLTGIPCCFGCWYEESSAENDDVRFALVLLFVKIELSYHRDVTPIAGVSNLGFCRSN
jgi:hypothetical protein